MEQYYTSEDVKKVVQDIICKFANGKLTREEEKMVLCRTYDLLMDTNIGRRVKK